MEDMNEEQIDNSFEIKNKTENNIKNIISQLKVLCNTEDVPMFVSVALKDDNKKTYYYNDCVLSSLGIHPKANRIAKLLLVANDADVEFPAHIKRDIEELSEFLSQLKSHTDIGSRNLTDNKLYNYVAVGDGLAEALPPKSIFKNRLEDIDLSALDEEDDE